MLQAPARTRVPRKSPPAGLSARASTRRLANDPAARRRSSRCGRPRSCHVRRVAASNSRASSTLASTRSGGGRTSLSGGHACGQQRTAEERRELVAEAKLVADRQLDVDALDAVGVIAQARQRNHDVLVDLERVGVLGDGRGARAVEPEFLARVGGHRDEAFRAARVRDAHDLRGGPGDRDRRRRRRCRPAAPSSAARGAWPWSRSRPPSRNARPDARGRPASRARRPALGNASM